MSSIREAAEELVAGADAAGFGDGPRLMPEKMSAGRAVGAAGAGLAVNDRVGTGAGAGAGAKEEAAEKHEPRA